MTASTPLPHRVALFATCLVETFRPAVGFAAIKLLRAAGMEVAVPPGQTCCGQPSFNSGDRAGAKRLAKRVIAEFEDYEAVVVPSGSCAGMIREHYPALFADDAQWGPRAARLAAKTHELTAFLVDVCGVETVEVERAASAAYHDSCSARREMKVLSQPRKLLASVAGLELREIDEPEECCGFGGTFCVKNPDISGRMVEEKAKAALATGADMLLAGDMGCLLNIAGRLRRMGSAMEVRHVAEVLAGDTETPGIAEPEK
ncbi:MAG: (Fe-S)-binding protein [Rhodospirillaceae bacterium]